MNRLRTNKHTNASAILVGLFVVLFLVICDSRGQSQPITFPTSMSVGEGDLFLRAQPWFIRSTDDPSGQGRELTEWTTRFMAIYGITENTALFTIAPYIDRELEEGGQVHDDRGLGDVEMFVRHTVYERNWPRRTFSISPFVGAALPTGDDDHTGLPPWRTLGSGSTDPFVGFALRDATLGEPHRFLSMRYTLNTETGGFKRGDMFEVNAAIKPPLASWETQTGEAVGINGMLEVNFDWQDHHEQNGNSIAGSTGTVIHLTPGLVYTRHRWILEAAVQVPVVQNIRGDGLENDYSVLVGAWWNF